jgi:hypothetical protein
MQIESHLKKSNLALSGVWTWERPTIRNACGFTVPVLPRQREQVESFATFGSLQIEGHGKG